MVVRLALQAAHLVRRDGHMIARRGLGQILLASYSSLVSLILLTCYILAQVLLVQSVVLPMLLINLQDLLQVLVSQLLFDLLGGLLLVEIVERVYFLCHIHAFIYIRVDLVARGRQLLSLK